MTKNHETIIRLERLELWCLIGIHSYERTHTQPLQIDIEITIPQTRTHHLPSTIDYTKLADDLTTLAKEDSFYLIEDLAESIASHVLSYPLAKTVYVNVRKPRALPNALASVSVLRHRSH